MIDYYEAKKLVENTLEEFAPQIFVELSDEALKNWLWKHTLVDTIITKEIKDK